MISQWILDQFYRFILYFSLCCFFISLPAHANTTQTTQTVRLGVLPDSDKQIIKQRFIPLTQYIEAKTGLSIELIIPENYEDLLTQFKNKSVDLAFFGGYTFVIAQQEAQAEALVMRDIDLKFSSVFLTQSDNPEQDIEDFKGKAISFGARLSTSGHIMPRYFLSERNIIPESFFKNIYYSNGHDETVYAVRDGHIDLGVVNSQVVDKMLVDGLVNKNEIRIIWKTPTYVNYVWAIQPNFDEVLHDRLLDSFLSLSFHDSAQQKILELQGANSFLPANNEDFEALRKATQIIAK